MKKPSRQPLFRLERASGISIRLAHQDFEKILKAILKKIGRGRKHRSVELRLVKASEMRRLNRLFRGKNKTTDVLSFESHSHGLLGSIVIDIGRAKTQARTYKHSLNREIQELFVHGVLHLLGHDHEKPVAAARMAKLEEDFNRRWTIEPRIDKLSRRCRF